MDFGTPGLMLLAAQLIISVPLATVGAAAVVAFTCILPASASVELPVTTPATVSDAPAGITVA